jgi:hypothetical protein
MNCRAEDAIYGLPSALVFSCMLILLGCVIPTVSEQYLLRLGAIKRVVQMSNGPNYTNT